MSNSSLNGSVAHAINNTFMKILASVTPVPKQSRFEEKRTITPAEFVLAGEYLVQTYPYWEWYGGIPSKQKQYLGGKNKQCLVVRQVPCNPIPQDRPADVKPSEVENDWIIAGDGNPAGKTQEYNDIPDVSVSDIAQIKEADPCAIPLPARSNQRVYDLYITYDLVLKVPRLWLVGFDSNRNPLSSDQISADLSQEHAGQTITWDPHPHEDFYAASIHPCRHAHMMKELMDMMVEQGKSVPVDHYLVVFLKFIIALIPTIEFDYSMSQ